MARVDGMDLIRSVRLKLALSRYISVGALLAVLCGFPSEPATSQKLRRVKSSKQHSFTFGPIRLSGRRVPVYVQVENLGVHHVGTRLVGDAIGLSVGSRTNGHVLPLWSDEEELNVYWLDPLMFRHRKSGDYLLAVTANGGQHDHCRVYYLDPHSLHLRPLLGEMGIIYGDPKGLAKGVIVAHSPSQYVDPTEAGILRHSPNKPPYFARTWRYKPKSHSFAAGRWRPEYL